MYLPVNKRGYVFKRLIFCNKPLGSVVKKLVLKCTHICYGNNIGTFYNKRGYI